MGDGEPAGTWPALSVAAAHAKLTAAGERFEMEVVDIDGRNVRDWKNAPTDLRQVYLNGRSFGAREFLVHEGERATYADFGRAVAVLANRLVADGVRKGDRVALVMRNLPEWPVAFFAAICAGAIVAPLNAWWSGEELAYGVEDAGAKVVILDGERFERVRERIRRVDSVKHIYVTRHEGVLLGGVSRLEEVVGPVLRWHNLPWTPLPDVRLDRDDAATIFYTSGTTGRPKGALGTHRNLTSAVMATAFATARNLLRAGLPPAARDPHAAPQRVALLSVPLFHVTGFAATLCPIINGGGKLVLMRKFDAGEALRLIEQERVTTAGGVPTIAWNLLDHPDRDRFDLSSLQQVTYGGAPSASELVRRIGADWPNIAPGNGWGMTETSATFASHVGRDYLQRPESCGPAAPVGDIEIRGPNGASALPTGEIGELWVRGPQVVSTYWNKPQATAETFVGGWLRTGDLARLDADGFLFIVDRAKDMLIRGGENIYCGEIESLLVEHPEVLDAAIVGVPHRTLGEEPAAIVQLRPGASVSPPELQAWVRSRVAAYKTPVKFVVHDGPLPRNVGGKLQKADLRALIL